MRVPTDDGPQAPRPRRSSMREVADRAGVAMSSVSRVLSEHPDVSMRMRRRVLLAVAELGYEPDLLAQSLRSGSTLSVGFVVSDISNPLLAQIALGAETALREGGYSMLLVNSEGRPELDARHIRLFFRQRRVDGLLLSLADERHRDTLDELAELDVPFTLIDRDLAGRDDASAVVFDHVSGITAAVEHLAALGHRHVGLVTGPASVRAARLRATALGDSCRRLGLVASIEADSFSSDFGELGTTRLLAQAEPPTAIIAGGNQILAGVLRTLAGRGLRIPDDVSIVTCDEVPLAEFLRPTLATILRDSSAVGRHASELLLEQIGGAEPRRLELPTRFAPAESCGPPRRG